jgi:hypothetical protein
MGNSAVFVRHNQVLLEAERTAQPSVPSQMIEIGFSIIDFQRGRYILLLPISKIYDYDRHHTSKA